MEKTTLNAEVRKELGKTNVKIIRKNGFIPGIVYRGGKENVNIKVDNKEFRHILHTAAGENVLINLKIKNDRKKNQRICIIKEIQRDPVKDEILHVDFNEISMTEKLKLKIPIVPRGEPEGVIKDGGILEHVLREVEVECLPTDIPEKIEVEVSSMKIGDTLYIKDLPKLPGVEILTDSELAILTVMAPRKEEEIVVPEEGELPEEPEVIAKGKKLEEETEVEETEEKKEDVPPKKE